MDLRPVLSYLSNLSGDLSSLVDGTMTVACGDTLESVAMGLEHVYRDLLAYEMVIGRSFTREQMEALDDIRAGMRIVREVVQRMNSEEECHNAMRERLRICLSRDQLESSSP